MFVVEESDVKYWLCLRLMCLLKNITIVESRENPIKCISKYYFATRGTCEEIWERTMKKSFILYLSYF